jgi:tagaturonate reductase
VSAPHQNTRPRLDTAFVRAGGLAGSDVLAPTPELLDLPEKAVQFGTGAFLRGFVDVFLDDANRRGAFGGRVVAVGSTESGRDVALNEQDGLYTVLVEGIENGAVTRERRVVASVSRALAARRDWDEILSIARSAAIELVFSNTTEIGIAIQDGDLLEAAPPPSFPGKLTRFLLERGHAFGFSDNSGVVVLPCELIEQNGARLRELVSSLAYRWRVEPAFEEWLDRAVPFCNTLVDRIVPGRPNDTQRVALVGALTYEDTLTIVAEPYRLFAIETPPSAVDRLRFLETESGVVLTDDITPFRERKVRILNGGHTLIASLGLLMGCQTVREAVEHELLGAYLRNLLLEEIVPSLTVPNGEQFAGEVLDRFANPFLRHALADITLQHTAKMRVRVVPSIVHVARRSGSVPPSLAFGFAAYLMLLRESPSKIGVGADNDGERVRASWRQASNDDQSLLRLVADVCGDRALWQTDLSQLAGFVELVANNLIRMTRLGVAAALEAHVGALATNGRAAPESIVSES